MRRVRWQPPSMKVMRSLSSSVTFLGNPTVRPANIPPIIGFLFPVSIMLEWLTFRLAVPAAYPRLPTALGVRVRLRAPVAAVKLTRLLNYTCIRLPNSVPRPTCGCSKASKFRYWILTSRVTEKFGTTSSIA